MPVSWRFSGLLALSCGLLSPAAARTADVELPTVADDRLRIELFAAEPDIVTPTGIAIDAQGRVLVIESHTHFRPEGYQGPPADRIRVFEDTDDDGRADRITTFFEGTTATMNLAVHPDGSIYVATRSEVFRLRDTDGDGAADERTSIARLETEGNYPHNGLSGFAFDFAGDVYFGLGENLGADYKLIGSDGVTLTGGGEGGNIYRCQADGGKLTQVATGFWNPFHLCFDAFGRLFAVDNDPDSRPPCRLLHIVPDGDYGYRFRNGRKGLHPFTAWNGELPGTLPMVTGTGEAPSGIVAYEAENLPEDYRGSLLGTSWGDHRIERFRLQPHGASFRSTAEAVVTGGENFRPVGIAIAADGSLFVSDWMDKSYNLHGKGRIWRISAVEPVPQALVADTRAGLASPDGEIRAASARALADNAKQGRDFLRQQAVEHDDARVRAVALAALIDKGDSVLDYERIVREDPSPEVRALVVRDLATWHCDADAIDFANQPPAVRAEILRRREDDPARDALLVATLADADPFLRQAALVGLRQRGSLPTELTGERLEQPLQRLGLLLLLRSRGEAAGRERLPEFLADADPDVRFAAVQWVAEERLTEYRPTIVAGLAGEATTRRLFEGYLAALAALDGQPGQPIDERGAELYVEQLLVDRGTAARVRRRALRTLRPDHPTLTLEFLKGLMAEDDPALAIEAVRTLRESPLTPASDVLRSLAANASQPTAFRAEAIVGLSANDPADRELLFSLAETDVATLRDEALRSLRGTMLSEREKSRLTALAQSQPQAAEACDRLLQPNATRDLPAADDIAGWTALLDGPADAAAGERIFFHAQAAACHRCHQMDGRGGRIGPDLTVTPPALSRERLIESILLPSKEIAPLFVPWAIETTDGRALVGLLAFEGLMGEQTYVDPQGRPFTLKPLEIAARVPHAKSLMPDGLEKTLTVQEFRDLLAYLRAAR
jgi:putative membrane-bound dehydrogenase-like protein